MKITCTKMASTGLLVVSNVKQFRQTLCKIEKLVSTLYVQLNIPSVSAKISSTPVSSWGRLISQLYMESNQHAVNKLDLRILVAPLRGHKAQLPRIDMLWADSKQPHELMELLGHEFNIPSHMMTCLSEQPVNDLLEQYQRFQNEDQKMYETVVLGGTFDRIHLGHKIFLTQAVVRACRRLVVGVTTNDMNKSKTLSELILPVEERIADVRRFLMEIDPSLHYDVVPIADPFGPTRTDPDMDMIVVSAETLRGGHKVNELRVAGNLRKLDIFCIEMVQSVNPTGPKESKISSSNTRIDMLGTRLRTPSPRPNLPNVPYLIGLTGGIASGKSRMAERFRSLGAVVFDCDKIAHEIYAPGQQCYDKIVAHFGKQILDPTGTIDRTKLGPIVFSDPNELNILNGIVWPELILELKRRIAALQPTPPVVVIEAAVLLRAGWECECHEVWSMIVSPAEAVQRVMLRNKLSKEEVEKRLASQLTNAEIVQRSNVVFSSEWSDECTTQQAEKAWTMLMQELQHKQCKM